MSESASSISLTPEEAADKWINEHSDAMVHLWREYTKPAFLAGHAHASTSIRTMEAIADDYVAALSARLKEVESERDGDSI